MTTQTKYRKYDSESDYYAMGYRMYSAEFGRFLAVDPLFEAMPRHNPYHYGFNSPMFWSDPSGLVPVKNKVKNSERLQAFEQDWGRIKEDNEAWAAIASIIDQINIQNYQNATATSTKGVFAFFGQNLNVIMFGGGGGGGGGTSTENTRTGTEGGAWQVNNQWNDKDDSGKSYSEKYSDYYRQRSQQAVENGEKFDCMDFQLRVLFEFARDNNLPLSLKNSKGDDISQDQYESAEAFWNELSKLSAKNLALNTTAIPYDQRQPGDMRLLKQNNDYHVVGYFDINKGMLVYGNLFKGIKQPVAFTQRDWTITNFVPRNNIIIIKGTENVLRWNLIYGDKK